VTASSDILLRCEGLTKVYDEIMALDDLNLEIPRGEVFGFIGHNGAGKTTTIRILAGLLKQTSGTAKVCGLDLNHDPNRIRSIVGYMPDSFGVYDQMRVWEYLDFFGAAFKIGKKKRRERIDFVLEATDSEYMRDRFVDTLSHGMKQRIGIARTLINDPDVLLLDEPLSGLDPRARIQMRRLLRRLADDGKTLLVSSHILSELSVICDSIGIIDKGRLQVSGPMETVLSKLQRDRLVELKALSGLDEAEKIIQGTESCSEIDRTDLDPHILRLRFAGDDHALAALHDALVKAGTRIVTWRDVPMDIEQAYMAASGLASAHVGKRSGAAQ
jgi:ABC-2 type transport system ATP-binding protein